MWCCHVRSNQENSWSFFSDYILMKITKQSKQKLFKIQKSILCVLFIHIQVCRIRRNTFQKRTLDEKSPQRSQSQQMPANNDLLFDQA